MLDLHNSELLFFEVLADLKEYLDDLVVVGGWLIYLYSKFLWRNISIEPITTVDIDFGLSEKSNKTYPKNIYQILSSLDYEQQHIKIGKIFPVVFYKKGIIPVEFIVDSNVNVKKLENLLGTKISVNKIAKFDFLIKNNILLKVKGGRSKNIFYIKCPKPSAFLYHRGVTFIDRENKAKQAKDLYYMYFILRYAEDLDVILKEIHRYYDKGYFLNDLVNIKEYFKRKTSPGCLMVEQENGPDEYIDDVRSDIFNRFCHLLEFLE